MNKQIKYLKVKDGVGNRIKRLIPITGVFLLRTDTPPGKPIWLYFKGTEPGGISYIKFDQSGTSSTPTAEAKIILKNSIIELLSNGESILDIDLRTEISIVLNG
jgi:hypothetical protein